MKLRAYVLTPSVARRIAVLCAAVCVASAHAAQAGVNVWTSHGPPGGHVSALAIDPNTPQTLYAGTDSAGVFKSTDAGATWSAANAGLTNINVSALAIDPNTPQTLYAGTGFCSPTGVCSGGVFKSTDAGATWSATGLPDFIVAPLAIDPITPRTLYAATHACIFSGFCSGGIFKSTDAGATWDAANAGLTDVGVFALAIDPNTPQTLYAGMASDGVFKSTDAGATWSAANAEPTISTVWALAIDPNTPRTLYAGTLEGMFKSTDAGATWSAPSAGLINSIVVAVAIDPNTPRTLYAGTGNCAGGYCQGGEGVFKSTDGGSTWNALNTGLTNTRVYALAIDPMEPRRVYAGTNGGVFAIEQVPPSCVGDCEGADTVVVNDLITLVNIALGTTQPSACPNGLPVGGDVNVAVIIQGVNNVLNGCGG